MIPPDDAEVFELSTGICWFDKDGILYSKTKNTPRTLENAKESVAFLKKLINGRKVCTIIEASRLREFDKESREYLRAELKNVYKAMAIVSTSPLGRMIANVTFHLTQPACPMKMFADEKEAREWIKQYL